MSAKATRQVFGETIAKLGETHPEIVVLDADLSKSTKSDIFAKKFPDRFFEMGIQEANMIGVAAGMANAGKLPFICSFSCFVTGRYDQIRLSVAYSNANVRIIGSHAGVGIGEDGFSQQGLEDIALMRALANMVVIQPADEVECISAMEFLVDYKGPAFIRTTRQNLMAVHAPDFKFQLGKSDTLREGTDVAIFATGGTVQGAVLAHEALEASGISARVVNVASLKPFDAEAVVKAARECKGGIVTVEDHQIVGGLGSSVAEAMAEAGVGAKLHRVGIEGFGESGTPEELYSHFQLDAAGIEARVRKFLGK
ncbi:MAG: transketolase family protein [Myxococcales bacterium]|jgi:transketolase|nr:transketolase family protein [Myxococcales bacterium]